MVVSRWFVMPIRDLLRARITPLEHTTGDGELTLPDVLRVVFHPAGMWIDLVKLLVL